MSATPWWRDAVVYQVYLRSFADADGDGIGDLAGLTQRLDHLVRLGVDALWLNPCYPSPGADHGYDIADYLDVDNRYGGLPALDALVAKAHERGLKVLLDLVPNHCSSAHEWFRAALAAEPGSPERERFLFRSGEQPPNNWRSVFGGPAWTRIQGGAASPRYRRNSASASGSVDRSSRRHPGELPGTDEWYLHSFDASQPDFNWRNPDVTAYFEKVLRFWFDRGVDGFRIDVAHMMVKHVDLPDWPFPSDGSADYNEYGQNQPEVHDILRSWRAIADSYGRDLALIGEVWVPTVADLARYLRTDELHQAFYFDLLMCPWNGQAFRASLTRGLAEIAATGANITWTLANHDAHRAVTRFGLIRPSHGTSTDPMAGSIRARGDVDIIRGERRARAALLLTLALPGSVYLYQGEELGLPEVLDLPDEARQDPIWLRTNGSEHGRDGCRVPLPWSPGGANLGFSMVEHASTAWLPQPEWFGRYSASNQWADPSSTLNLHATALRVRRDILSTLTDLEWLPTPTRPDVIAFRRGTLVCVISFGGAPMALPAEWGTVILTSAPLTPAGDLPPDTAAWLSSPPDAAMGPTGAV